MRQNQDVIFPWRGDPMRSVQEIEGILRQELDIYGTICFLEERKSDAIISRDGKLIETLAVEQEKILGEIAALEEKRRLAVDDFRKANAFDIGDGDVTLGMLAASLDEESSRELVRLGQDLKQLLLKIQSLADTNEKLGRDNIEFFNILLSELKSKVSLKTGYNRGAQENSTIENPLIFNRMV